MKNQEKYISILNKGYFGSRHLYAALATKSIHATTNVDNGFVTAEVEEEHLQTVVDFVTEYLGERLQHLEVSDTHSDAVDFRQSFWTKREEERRKGLLQTLK